MLKTNDNDNHKLIMNLLMNLKMMMIMIAPGA